MEEIEFNNNTVKKNQQANKKKFLKIQYKGEFNKKFPIKIVIITEKFSNLRENTENEKIN